MMTRTARRNPYWWLTCEFADTLTLGTTIVPTYAPPSRLGRFLLKGLSIALCATGPSLLAGKRKNPVATAIRGVFTVSCGRL